ncbi:MAG: DNA repair protein RadC [bacterium]|nr:DNA repair protein RadC [bacterium]
MNKKKVYPKAILNWPKDERPREKLLKNGEHTLSNSELLAILLRTGIKGQSAIDLARSILQKFKTFRNLSHTDLSHWKEFKGLGQAKIAQIKAAIEIGRRFREDELKEEKIKIKSAKDVVDILMPRMRDLKKEVFKIVLLDSQNSIIDIIEIAEGTVNQAAPIIREIFQKALQHFTSSIICVHNHPSGDSCPSKEDRDFTMELFQAGKIIQVKVLDHIIIGDNKHYSFADEGGF